MMFIDAMRCNEVSCFLAVTFESSAHESGIHTKLWCLDTDARLDEGLVVQSQCKKHVNKRWVTPDHDITRAFARHGHICHLVLTVKQKHPYRFNHTNPNVNI